ncbi:hypothetical protein RFM68_24545 [Mesorhizobium sp. MSK_1335]|uniref:GNAT family N-acetyltransferase n=1 Tax=Mesorhizobium montanum TaxID=3072323 RepID=A0ABU4ZQI3_9HYPH|nr:hypothetical protein [Mesorhizobium sp. MSK_1335]MDX8527673.1 hypothetical protein [Mesorhizobium sp. MSK_1335]
MVDAGEKARLCAGNNADLCRAVFKANGLRDQRNEFFWSSEEQAPSFYPNAVTLHAGAMAAQLAEISRLTSVFAGSFAVKDGFCRLDLQPLGFRPLFEAGWIWMDLAHPTAATPGWERVEDASSLEMWELAWADGGNQSNSRVVPTAILNDDTIAILGRRTADGFSAGCIANRSEQVIGLSNVFVTDGSPPYRDAARAAANAFAGGRALVGYERDGALDEALNCGFQATGMLRIWLRDLMESEPR